MRPLVVRAHVTGAVMMPNGAPGLDALLMAAWAQRENLPPMGCRDGETIGIPPEAVPIARSGCGRIYLATIGQYEPECHERRFLNRKFPMLEAQALSGPKVRSINIKGGPSKSYRIPTEQTHLRGDVMIWYALGQLDAVRALVELVTHIGKKRSVGLGAVGRWEVEECESWEGFPVLLDGRPLRPLPLDWPGLGEHRIGRRVLVPPYWERWREEECAVA